MSPLSAVLELARASESGDPHAFCFEPQSYLRFAAAELYSLPWELLTLKASGQHLGELPGVLIRYAWPETESAPEKP